VTTVHDYKCSPPYGGYYGPDRVGVTTGGNGEVTSSPIGGPIAPSTPQPNAVDDTDTSAGSNDSGDDGGCQMGRGKSGSTGALLLAMLGLLAGRRRRVSTAG
jgi:MYXO-CTERM domain-containing protein